MPKTLNSSEPNCPSVPQPSYEIRLGVRGYHIPSFKNTKMLTRGKLITHPKKQKVMEQIIQSFVSRLRWAIPTTAGETLTVQQAHYLIASYMPEDDSWQWIPELKIKAIKVLPGSEGAEILIEKIS